jgi:hypothetical protein
MKNINLNEYFNLPMNKILKIKLEKQDNFIYGRLISAGGLYTSTMQLPPEQFPTGTLKKINDYEKFTKDKLSYNDYTLIGINSSNIEIIEEVNI